MEHQGTVDIATPRLLLRPFVQGDADAAFRNWTGDEKVTQFLRWPTHRSVETTESILAEWIASYEKKDFYQWAIVPKALGKPIGTISVVDQNERVGMVHIGYCIGNPWWGQGITSEAFGAIIPFLFDQVKANRIESQHDPNNPGSGKVMQRCGLRYEGTHRQADYSNAGIVDAALYALLASEYEAARPKPSL